MTEEIQKYEGDQGKVESNTMIMAAIEKGFDPSFIEKMMDLAERNEKNVARKAYYAAVSAFKENPPEVLKDRENKQFSRGDDKSMYASLGNMLKTVNPALGKHGLSASFDIEQGDKIKVTCRLSHSMGHSESVSMEAPPDTSGGNSKNPIQQIKSTLTYLRAVTFEAITGISASEEANLDDDGNSLGVEKISPEQVEEMKAMPESWQKYIRDFSKVDDLEDVPVSDYAKIKAVMAEKKKKKQREPGQEG